MTFLFSMAAFLSGIVAGLMLHYFVEYKTLFNKYVELVNLLAAMKRQGFVPQFEIEQYKSQDLSKGIVEY